MKIKFKKEIVDDKEDHDFDFSIYEGEEQEDELVESIVEKSPANITNLKSKFSPGEIELQQISDMSFLMKKYGMKVEERTQDITILWKFYGVVSEYWACVVNIFGSVVQKEINVAQIKSYDGLKSHKIGPISHKIHEDLLYFRKLVYKAKQFSNLNIEVEKKNRGVYQKSRSQILQ